MKTKMKWLSAALTLCLIVSGLLVIVAAAGEGTLAAEAAREGIQAQLSTSKDTYAEKEAIDVTLSIGNSTDKSIANVVTTITVPDSLSVERGSLNKTYEELVASQLAQNKTTVSLGGLEDVSSEPGIGAVLTVSLIVLFASAAVLLYLFLTGKIKLNKNFCLILLAGVMVFSLIPKVQAADTDENKLEVAKKITVAGEEVTLTAVVTWEAGKPVEITRGMAEQALSNFLWAFYAKGEWGQYNSTGGAGVMPYTHGGYSPLGKHFNTLEDATSQAHLFTVCSNYAWLAYWNTMGMPIYGDPLNAGSVFMWSYVDTSVANGDEDDMCIMRWHNYACDSSAYPHEYIQHEDCISTGPLSGPDANGNYVIDIEPIKQWFANWEENLRPGDIIRLPGHIITYAGNGWILEATGGQYKDSLGGYDSWESGGVIIATTVQDYFFPVGFNTTHDLQKYAQGSYTKPDSEDVGISVVRPLDRMFIDDGDGDPTNDLLNTEYYHPGVDTLNWQLEELDSTTLPHTGYTIQNDAFTRMQFPMMNINRTVSVGVYGYVAMGETFTYNVEIINQTNDEKYITTRGDGYTGEKFVGVPIVEFLPEGVELVETNAAVVIGNTLYWTADVEAGESFDAYYTVRAVGQMGDEIVNESGMVGAIPSNRLVTTIGGKYLSEETVAEFVEFYETGWAAWNSNDGYKITANKSQDASVLAEQIYKIAGLDLDMPAMNDLVKALFDQEYIEIAAGLYGQWGSSKASWQYTLVDTTANAENQVWRDMIMNGSFIGGRYLWTNNYDRTTRRVSIPRVDNLMAGDFILALNMKTPNVEGGAAYEVKEWKILFYLGDNKFATLDSNGVLTGMEGHNELEKILTYDLYFGMRPSQAYADIYESLNTYTGSFADLTAADMAWSHRGPSQVKLSDAYKEKIANMTVEDIPSGNSKYGAYMVRYVYDYIGLDIATNAFDGRAWNGLMRVMFADLRTDTENFKTYGHEYHLLNQSMKGYEALYNMLMFYDGPAFADENPDGTMNKPLTGIDDIEIGDVIIMGHGTTAQSLIYQGVKGGKYSFLSSSYCASHSRLGYFKEIKAFDTVQEFIDHINGPVIGKDGKVIREDWYLDGYLVMRPARGFININNNSLRDMKNRALTADEKEMLASVTTGTGGALTKFAVSVYKQSFIDISSYVTMTVNNAFWNIFPGNGIVSSDLTRANVQMLVKDSWGGSYFNEKTGVSYRMSMEDFQIGDIFCSRYAGSGGNVYWNAVYQGNGQFIVSKGSKVSIEVYDDINSLYEDENWYYYFVLRPNQLVTGATVRPETPPVEPETPAVTGRELTEAEKAAIANVSVWDYYNMTDFKKANGYNADYTKKSHKSNLAKFVSFVYDVAGIEIGDIFGTLSVANMAKNLFNPDPSADGSVTSLEKGEANAKYVNMLVGDAYGGNWVTFAYANGQNKNDLSTFAFQVGDVLGVRTKFASTDGNTYLTAIYLGNDQFLVNSNSEWCETFTKAELLATMYGGSLTRNVYADNQKQLTEGTEKQTVQYKEWNVFFVLRPAKSMSAT